MAAKSNSDVAATDLPDQVLLVQTDLLATPLSHNAAVCFVPVGVDKNGVAVAIADSAGLSHGSLHGPGCSSMA